MKTNGMLAVGGLVICGVAAWIALEAHASAAAASRRTEQRVKELAALMTRAETARQQTAALDARCEELQAKVRVARSRGPVPAAAKPEPGSRSLERTVLLHDPALQALWANAAKARIARTFGPFYAERGLSPEQVAAFEAALMKREEAKLDLAATAESQGAESRAAVAALEATVDADFKAALAAALGSQGAEQLQAYERTLGPKMIVATIGSWAALEGVPLTDAQAQHLTATIASAAGDGTVRTATVDWNAIDAEARRVLSPAQSSIVGRVRVEGDLDSAISKARTADAAANH